MKVKAVSSISKNNSGAHPQPFIGEGADSKVIYNLCLFLKIAL
jgi:hypothetical protein